MLEVHHRNPNFPADLNIFPSATTTTKSSVPHNLGDAFGRAAQELAILQYGIAGKVWCVICDMVPEVESLSL